MNKYILDGHKLYWHMDRVHEHFRDGKRIAPIHIDIGVTKQCNAKCIYCYGIFQRMNGNKIPEENIVKLFEEAPKAGVKSLAVIGDGEPTLNKGIYKAIPVGRQRGLDIAVATNGIALVPEELDILLSNCVWVRFNLSAVGRAGYKKIHGVDKWKAVKNNIETAIKIKTGRGYKCTLGLQMVLVPGCLNQVIPEAKFAIDAGVDYFVIKQFSDPRCEDMPRFSMSWYDNPSVIKVLARAEKLSTDKTKIIPKWNTISSKGIRLYDHCVDCPLIFQISGDGKCYPCGYLFGDETYCYGDLTKQTLGEILASEHYWNVIKYMREEFDVHRKCFGCCRHDATNAFIWKYLNPPEHINFI
jgi:MoaA/NifB/PqqE/SkfB family radical SAM enzyme